MNISIKLRFRPSQKEGREGALLVQIHMHRVSYQHTTKYKIFTEEWDFRKSAFILPSQNNPRYKVLTKIRNRVRWELSTLRHLANRMLDEDEHTQLDEILESWHEIVDRQPFFCFMKAVIDKQITNNKIGTSEKYLSAKRSFERFIGNQDLMLYEITSDLIEDYQQWLINDGVCMNSISFYMRILRSVFNRAVKQNLVVQNHPFVEVYTGIAETKKRAIDLDSIQRIKDLELKRNPNLELARDLFLFSFYCRGMAFVDMAHLTNLNLSYCNLIYHRQKTRQQITIRCEPPILGILAKYQSQDSHLLPIIKDSDNSPYKKYKQMNKNVCRWLKEIGKIANIKIPLTIYVARHSWTSIANQRKHPLSTISKALGHTSERTTRIYLATLDNSAVDNANKDILNELK